MHAWAIAGELGIDRILVPKAAPAFSALGVLVADYVVDLVRSYVDAALAGRPRPPARRSWPSSPTRPARSSTRPASTAREADVALYVQMCYPGQNFDMSVPVPEGTALDEAGLLDLAERFHDQHEADRGFCFRSQQPLVRGVRLVARGTTPKPDHFAELGHGHATPTQAPHGHAAGVLRGRVRRHAGLRRRRARRGRRRSTGPR